MEKKAMSLTQFNKFMGKCADNYYVRSIVPTIHPRLKLITALTIHTHSESVEFTITNSDVNFNLNKIANDYVDNLTRSRLA